MLAKLRTHALVGIDAVPVEVEVDIAAGLPKTVLVGLPELAVKESIHRIERALENLRYRRPQGRTVINLAPADLRKDAGAFDLPIALGILVAKGDLPADTVTELASVGELALDGTVRPIKGALAVCLATKREGIRRLLVPAANAREAAVVEGVEVYPIASLTEAVGLLTGNLEIAPLPGGVGSLAAKLNCYPIDFADVRGQEAAKRALVVSAAGSHNLLMLGPPGSGKTMLAQRLPTILPPLTLTESLETSRIYSATGRLPTDEPLLCTRPFRSPHHTISDAGMVGGGNPPAPGEISLAHHGVLFLDELAEFHRKSLEVMRQPLEEGQVTIARALTSTTFPARFVLIAAMNPCPCGFLGDPRHQCKCTPPIIERYMARLSGPMLDRIDLHIEVPAVPFAELSAKADGTSSAEMRRQVDQARDVQRQRYGLDSHQLNSRMTTRQLRKFCELTTEGQGLIRMAMDELGLSARAHDRILRVARTLADLEGSDRIEPPHVMEAIGYRSLDRKLWAR